MFEPHQFNKQRLFGIDFSVVTMQEAVDWVFHSVATGRRSHSRYVVTPNVALTMRHQKCADFRKVIHHADLTIVDGMPLVTASRWLDKELPERVAGSDLVFNMFDAAIEEMPLRVFLMGAAEGVADRAARIVHERWPAVKIVGTLSPDFGFEKDVDQNSQIVTTINATEPDVLIVGLGAPKQETWAFNHRTQISAAVTLCVGGTIDFIAGEQKRAPAFFRKAGIEWIWRLSTNPQRLLKRYVGDAIRLPKLFLNEIAGRCPAYKASKFKNVDSVGPQTAEAKTTTTSEGSSDEQPFTGTSS